MAVKSNLNEQAVAPLKIIAMHNCSEIGNKINDILFVGTGALLSSGSVLQKMSIPGIAHLVRISRTK